MSTPTQSPRSNSGATSNTVAVSHDDQESSDEHTLTARSETASLREAQETPAPEGVGESHGSSQASNMTNTPGGEPPILSHTSSTSPTTSAPHDTPVSNLLEFETTRAARVDAYVTESQAWYSRLRPVEANDGSNTTQRPQEMAAHLVPTLTSLEEQDMKHDDTRTGSSALYPARIVESTEILVEDTSEDNGEHLDVPMPPFIIF
ncbi:hypothetical protein B0T20DRAFT_38338 [Sordaria brevicollis]|uniref:Uncharacterized protein n=1 Tax=Sordaria brevicollis TaxID=83679 RepID=A0AAE0U9B2_SORBR|nr:hypothetical protein B0T20DRAFT_38338 [Sordaria brevicollis]